MKILQIGPVTPEYGGKTIGGVATHLIDLSKNLAKKNHEVFILSSNCEMNYYTDLNGLKIYGRKKNIIFQYLITSLLNYDLLNKTADRFFLNKRFFQTLFNYTNMKYFIEKIDPDIIHIHHIQSEFSYLYEILQKKNIPYVATTHSYHCITFNDGKEREKNFYLVNKNMRDCKNLIYVSSHLKDESQELFDQFPENEKIIPNPIDTKRFYLLDKNKCKEELKLKHEKIIIYVGSIIKRKGYDLLLNSIAKLDNLDVHVIFIGNGESDELSNLAKNLKITEKITLINYISQDDLIKYYNASDLMVIPSSSESFGLIYIEAMACGIPVIGTVGVPQEVIPSEDLGFRVSKNNCIELAQAIEKSLEKRWDRKKLRNFAENFSWDSNIDKYINTYTKIIESYNK